MKKTLGCLLVFSLLHGVVTGFLSFSGAHDSHEPWLSIVRVVLGLGMWVCVGLGFLRIIFGPISAAGLYVVLFFLEYSVGRAGVSDLQDSMGFGFVAIILFGWCLTGFVIQLGVIRVLGSARIPAQTGENVGGNP